jgi:hypothetical protein
VARRLDEPREVDHRVRAAEEVHERGRRDVRLDPRGAWPGQLRPAAGEPDDLGDGRLGDEGVDEAGPDVPRGAGDDDAHPTALPDGSRDQTRIEALAVG